MEKILSLKLYTELFQENTDSMSNITALGLGPVLDWTLDNGLLQRYQVWKRKVNIIFNISISQGNARDKVQLFNILVRG